MAHWQVLVVEDDAQTRAFFAASVSGCAPLVLAAAVGTHAEAVAWLQQPGHVVDVLLVDLGLPDGSGLDIIRRAVRLNPNCEPLVISMFGDEDNVLASIEAGALGYIHKDAAPDDIAQVVLDMLAGASPISPMIARRVLSKYRASALQSPEVPQRPPVRVVTVALESPRLSPRETEVLSLIARGFSYAEIARLHTVSIHTVQTQIKSLYSKLAVNSKTEAVFEATRMGLLHS
ncbi:MAG: response regulator transcription factor [Rhodoferax sp.]|uniref:response regulator transcription factor n=1 Tax=Rhodoferax sp. TaxID=50421 RepID=UPI003265A83B